MWKSIIRLVRGSQRGFTLIELLAVMAVIGVLAGIVTTSVSGTGETSTIAQARSDAGTVESAAGTFFTDQDATEVLSPKTVAVTAAIASSIDATLNADGSPSATFGIVTYDATIDTDTGAVTDYVGADAATPDNPPAVTQVKSSRWPEVYLTENEDTTTDSATGVIDDVCNASRYCQELPTTTLFSDGVVIKVIVTDSDGAAIDRTTLLEDYTALDFDKLSSLGYVAAKPDSVEQTAQVDVGSSKTIEVHNFLWLFRKNTSAGGSGENDSRSVTVFKLASVQVIERADADDDVTLSYAQIF